MDLTSVLGIISGFLLIIIAIQRGGASRSFFDLSAILITVGGSLAATVVSFRKEDIGKALSVASIAFKQRTIDYTATMEQLISLADLARREGLIALDNTLDTVDDEFLKRGLQLVVDGIDPEIIHQERTNVILGEKIENLYGPGYITDFIGDVKYQISPLSFYQVNPVQTEKLYGTALEYAGLTGDETVWDLYCGIGTISLFLAQKAKKAYGVEIVPQAIDDAKENARINGIENVEFFVGKVEEVLPQQYEKNKIYADVIVVDPPRKGCDQVCLDTIVKMAPKRVVYVSCDSATLARDLKYLGEKGYEVVKVRGCDMFPATGHVESVIWMQYCGIK